MKVWFITMQFPTPRETFVNNDIKALQKAGVQVSIHSLRPKHNKFQELMKQRNLYDLSITHNSISSSLFGILIGIIKPHILLSLYAFIIMCHFFKPEHLIKSLILAPRILYLYYNLVKGNPDVVHLYWAHYPSMLGYLVKKYRPEIKLTMTFVAYDLHMRYKGSFIVANLADIVFTIARIEVNTLINLGVNPLKIQTVYHGIMPHYFKDVISKKINDRVISAGAFVNGKNMDKVVIVFAKVQKEFPNASLVLLGDGPLTKETEELVKKLRVKNVSFLGHVDHETVIEQMRKAEVFLFMSEDERLPNVIKEAMIARCYCITTDTPGINELITNGESGSTIDVGDIRAAEESLKKALIENSYRKKVVEKAYFHIKENFNVEECMKKYINAWKKIMDKDQ